MAELLLTQAVNQAEEAIESGNYGGAIETCQRILGEFPEFARAHRIMAEAYAEQGDADASKQAYQRTLERDPQSISAHIGLGMIAEEAEELEAALAHFQVAWEIDPRRRDLREHVSRVSQEVYGNDGRLYLTRAALASLHFHAGRWDRAITEAAQVLQELNQRVDVQVRMAEALWRRGDDEQARQVCSSILRTLPSAVVPLLILADIHRREGDASEAAAFRTQARAIDPDGVRAADLIMVGFDDQADFLSVEEIPTIEERVLTEEPAARYVPAPDFSAEVADADESAAETVVPETPMESTSTGEPTPDDSLQPFRWEDVGDEDLETSDLDPASEELEEDLSTLMQGSSPEETATPDTSEDETVSFDLFTDEEIDQARPSDERPAGFTGMLQSLDSEGVEPFDPMANGAHGDDLGPEKEKTPQVDESQTAEQVPTETPVDDLESMFAEDAPETPEEVESTEEISGDPFDLDWSQVDEEIQDAIPGETPRGYTDELRDLDSAGVEPFAFDEEESPDTLAEDVTEGGGVDEPVEDLTAGVAHDQGEQPVEDAMQDLDLDELTRDWGEAESVESDEAIEMGPPAEDSADQDSIDDLFGEFATAPFEPVVEETPDEVEEPDVAEPEEFEVPPAVEFDFDEPEIVAGETRDLGVGATEQGDAQDVAALFADQLDDTEPAPDEAETEGLAAVFDEQEVSAGPTADSPEEDVDIDGARESAVRLGLTADLFDRARGAKAQMIEEGRLESGRNLPGFGGVTLDDLRESVFSDPDNADHRIALASALIDSSPDEALDQFRWIYRNAPDRGPEIVDDLARLIEVTREREVGALRLLGAVCRRHGDWLAAASHYEESLIVALRNLR